MFKLGDQAVVVATGKHTTVKAMLRDSTKIETTDGLFEESELLQGHQTVLDNASLKPQKSFMDTSMDEVSAEAATANYALRDEVSTLLKAAHFDLDFRGHWKSGEAIYDRERFVNGIMAEMWLFGRRNENDLLDLKKALTEKKVLDRWISLGHSMSIPMDGCSYCGARRFSVETNGATLRLSGNDCPLPRGFDPHEWELNVPSGRIVVANDLRKWFPLPEGDGDLASVNTVLGCRQTTKAYADVGMAHAFVGNTCPGVFKLEDGKFKIANEPPDEYWNGTDWVAYEQPPVMEGKQVGSITTDLWWYSMCDGDEFKRRTKKFGGSLKTADAKTIKVKPGVYRFRHNDEVPRHEDRGDEETVFATFEWVREPDERKDYLKAWQDMDVNAHSFVQAQVKRWPTLYGACRGSILDEQAIPWADMTDEQRVSSWRKVADQIFCTIGSGTEWHKKGFPQSRVEPGVPDIEPPTFRQQYHWYPFSKSYGGLFEPKTLAPSFAKLAFRVLESVISFGMNVRDGDHSREVPYTRDRMRVAVTRYRELAKQHPDQADPEYVWWLNQEGRAEAWVERFDLGPTFTEKHRKNVRSQRWVPEDAYAVEFDARKLSQGNFAGEYGWAGKENASAYAIKQWSDNGQAPEHNCCWMTHAKNHAIPLYSVARVVKLGQVSHMGETIVEVAFDYGTPWMKNAVNRKGLSEKGERDAIRVITKEEYEALLPKAEAFMQGDSQ